MTAAAALEALQSIQLQTIPTGYKIVDENGRADPNFRVWWQRQTEALEGAIETLAATLEEQGDTIATLLAYQIRQETLTAMTRTRDSAAAGLTVTGGATDVTVSSHTRTYLEPTETVNVTGAVIAGLVAATTYYVHYTDSEYEGGAVGYQTSDTYEGAIATELEPYRHFVGKVTTGGGAGTPDPQPYWKRGIL